MTVQFFLQGGLESRPVGTFDPERIARYQGLAEYDHPAALCGRLADPLGDLGHRRVTVEPDRRDLRDADQQCPVVHDPWRAWFEIREKTICSS